jgi:hypothetical protein
MTTTLLQLHALGLLLWAAQSPPEGSAPPGSQAEADSGNRFFRMTIDFWKTGPRKETPAPRSELAPERARETIWAEPIRQPDGSYSLYVPPKPVLAFLENPTPESLKGYLDWKRARAEKLRRAMELLEDYRAKEEALKLEKDGNAKTVPDAAGTEPPSVIRAAPANVDAAKPATPPGVPPRAPILVTYFHGKGCPHCTKQDRILAEWLARHPEASVRVLELGESPELWLRHRVRGTPSLLFGEGDDGVLLEGLSEAARLDQALLELERPRRGIESPPAQRGVPPAKAAHSERTPR